jgi:hypothetical protein
MSHFIVLVTNTNKVPLADQLAPTADRKWDWYEIGGRWAGRCMRTGIFRRRADVAKVRDIKSIASTFAIVHNGRWYERGHMGWWGMVSNEKPPEVWRKKFDSIIKSLEPTSELSLVDCHI